MATSTSGSGMQLDTRSSYLIKPKTMTIPFESFDVQVESPVDFASLKRNGMNLDALIEAQRLFDYIRMLNGPTYVKLVKDFWVRAEVYDQEAAKLEETQAMSRDPSLKGKSRKEMGLEPYKRLEIRSAVMGIPITITKEVIARACRIAPEGRFQWNVSKKNPLLESYTNLLLKGDPSTKLVDMDGNHRMLLKFITDCFFQKGGGSDQPSLDPKLVLYFLASYQKINLPRYLMHHLCWAIKEGVKEKRKQVPCGRLLSEIFSQRKLLETLRKSKLASDRVLGTATGKIINGKTLQNMKIIKKFSPNEKDLKESSVQSELMRDFPPISKEDNPEVLAGYIAAHARETSATIQDEDIPDTSDGAPLRVKGKRTKADTESEAAVAKAKKQKVAKSEATNYDSGKAAKSEATNYDSASAPTPKRKWGKGDSSITNEEVQLALEEMDAEEQRPSKRQPAAKEIVSPIFIVTPAMANRAKEHADNLIAEKKKKKSQYLLERDEKLKAIGQENCAEYYVEKIVEVKKIASGAAQDVVKEVQKVLEKNQGTPEAGASGSVLESAAPDSTSKADRSETTLSGNPFDHNSAKVTQILVSTTIIISPLSSPLTDSDQDNITLS